MARVIRKVDEAAWTARKAAKDKAKAHQTGNAPVKEQLDTLRQALGMVPGAKNQETPR